MVFSSVAFIPSYSEICNLPEEVTSVLRTSSRPGVFVGLQNPDFFHVSRNFVARNSCFLTLDTEGLHFANVALFWSHYSVRKLTNNMEMDSGPKPFTYAGLPNTEAVVLEFDHRWRWGYFRRTNRTTLNQLTWPTVLQTRPTAQSA